jgi:hypothetical protein
MLMEQVTLLRNIGRYTLEVGLFHSREFSP